MCDNCNKIIELGFFSKYKTEVTNGTTRVSLINPILKGSYMFKTYIEQKQPIYKAYVENGTLYVGRYLHTTEGVEIKHATNLFTVSIL